MFLIFLLVIFSKSILCEVTKKSGKEGEEIMISAQMLGVNTVHDPKTDYKVDKDTIITMTRNLKVEQRSERKNANTDPKMDQPTSYSAVPERIRVYVEEFKKNMTECLKEVQDNDKRPVRRISPKVESPVHGECLIACVLKRNGVIENKKVNKNNLITLVSKFFGKDTKLMKKLEKNLDQCIERSAHHHDECDLASRLNECTNDLMAANKHQITVIY